jgi:hypothetical protein
LESKKHYSNLESPDLDEEVLRKKALESLMKNKVAVEKKE